MVGTVGTSLVLQKYKNSEEFVVNRDEVAECYIPNLKSWLLHKEVGRTCNVNEVDLCDNNLTIDDDDSSVASTERTVVLANKMMSLRSSTKLESVEEPARDVVTQYIEHDLRVRKNVVGDRYGCRVKNAMNFHRCNVSSRNVNTANQCYEYNGLCCGVKVCTDKCRPTCCPASTGIT